MGWSSSRLARLAVGHGVFYLATGLWPLLSMRSFEAVTGKKRERWLVQTVSVLVTAVGAVLTRAGVKRRVDPNLALLATSCAAGLAVMDCVHARSGRISPVYYADAVVELALVGAWMWALKADRVGDPLGPGGGRRGHVPERWGVGVGAA